MSAEGFLYADETCRDFAKEKLDKKFGKGKWYLDCSEFNNYDDTSTLPDEMNIPIVDNDKRQIGMLIVTNKFFVNDDGHYRWVDVIPRKLRVV